MLNLVYIITNEQIYGVYLCLFVINEQIFVHNNNINNNNNNIFVYSRWLDCSDLVAAGNTQSGVFELGPLNDGNEAGRNYYTRYSVVIIVITNFSSGRIITDIQKIYNNYVNLFILPNFFR